MRSMTGFGLGIAENDSYRVQVELKSVNGKFLDINTTIPKSYSKYEDLVKQAIKEKLTRGTIDARVSVTKHGGEFDYEIDLDENLAKKVVLAGRVVSEICDLPFEMNSTDVLKFNEVMKFMPNVNEVDSETMDLFLEASLIACKGIVDMQEFEGENLKRDLTEKIDALKVVVDAIKLEVPLAIQEYREKLKKRIEEALCGVEIDEAKLLNEVAFFVDKFDINEELVRLNSHIEQFKSLINGNTPCGKKLEFLTQELTREINTTGSKSSNVKITSLVLEAKTIVETIKEQIRNVE